MAMALNNSFIVNAVEVDDGRAAADELNKFFANTGNSLSISIPEPINHFYSYLKSAIPESISLFQILTDTSEIINIVSKLPSKNAVGYDDILLSVLKSSIIYMAEIISKIINYSFQTEIFPDDLKLARVCPIFKDGEKHELTNYRRISVLFVFPRYLKRLYRFYRLYRFIGFIGFIGL